MSERIVAEEPMDQGIGQEGLAIEGVKQKKSLDPGAKKNLLIIGGAVGAAILVMGVMFVTTAAPPGVTERGLPATTISAPPGSTRASGDLSPEELARLDRVVGREADAAAAQGVTFVPSEIPLVQERPVDIPQPIPASFTPPGMNYHVGSGGHTQGQSQADAERLQRMMQGFQLQMARIADSNVVPPTSSAPRYSGQGGASGQGSAQSAPQAQSEMTASAPAASPTPATLVAALSISAAETITAINTERTSFVSARVVAGPAAGATLYGASEMVADQGVRITFNRMLLDGQSYTINAIALDPADSHDLLNANVDRKRFERYVLPILGSMGSAYFTARAQQATRVVTGPSGDVVAVEQNEPTARQSVAQALAAGMATAVEQIANQPTQPSATLPAGVSLGILFLDPVAALPGRPGMQQTSWR